MKKKQMIKGLIIVGLIGVLGNGSSSALAEEQDKPVDTSASSESTLLNKTKATEEITPTTIEITSEKTTLAVNETLALTTEISSESNIKTTTWTTSDETIATVSNTGIVTGKKAGTVSITASTSNEKSASVLLTVTEKEQATTGTYGTVPWTWDIETQTLTFGGGDFPPAGLENCIVDIVDYWADPERRHIKHIIFTKAVKANKDSSYLFSYLSIVESIDGLELLDTSMVSEMSYMFAESMKYLELDLSTWDTSTVTNMSHMFYNTTIYSCNLSKWNTSNVTDMSFMFSWATIFSNPDVSEWDTSNVTDMSNMFESTWNITKLDVSKWNTSKVTNVSSMFYDTRSVTELDISKWDISNVTKTVDFLYNTNLLNTLVLGENSASLLKQAGLSSDAGGYFIYTGKWILVSSDTQNSYASTDDLMANYDGTKPGKYVREKDDYVPINYIVLTPSSLALTVSEEATLQAEIIPEFATNKKVIYSTSDSSVATVSTDGVVKGLKKGKTSIWVQPEDSRWPRDFIYVTVTEPSSFLLDTFYLGIDDYVIGSIMTSSSAKKIQLVINDEVITTSTIFRDGSFELDTDRRIKNTTDKVEVIALDRKNKELERATVTLEQKSYSLTVNPYTLYEDSILTGQTDYFHTHVALVVDGEEIEQKLLSSTRQFTFEVEDLIDYADDEVEIIGYRYEEEITRKNVTVEEPKIDLSLTPYKVDDHYLTGKVTGKSATTVRLYVNRRRQQTVKIAEDGTFNLLGVAILSPTDKVEIAVLNDAGIEIQRFSVEISK